MIAFFIYLHIVKMRDDRNVTKITNSKKISVLLKMVRFIQISFVTSTCEYGQWLLKVGDIVQIWNKKLEKYRKK